MRPVRVGASLVAAAAITLFGMVRIVGGLGVEPFDGIVARTDESEAWSDRFVALDAAFNTRDIGGYPTAHGPVRSGRFYRSGHLSRLSSADVRRLEQLGIRTIVDLREPARIERYPNRAVPGARLVHLPIYDSSKPLHLTLLLNRRALSERFRDFYIEYLEEWAHRFEPVFRLLSDESSYPVLVHCTNGKDRVGVLTALLLEVLGVPRETIVADFLLSNAHLDEVMEAFIAHEEGRLLLTVGVPREHIRILMGVERDWIVAALEHLDERYGGVESYLISRVGLSHNDLEEIRELFGVEGSTARPALPLDGAPRTWVP